MAHSKFDRLFMPALAGLIGLYIALFIYYVFAIRITVPILDVLESILSYDQYWRTGDWWPYVWLPRNQHRPIWLELLALIDIEWFHGTTLPYFLFNTICFLLTVGGVVWAIWLSELESEFRAILAAGALLLLSASYAAIYCSVPIEGTYVHTSGFFVLALVLLDGPGEGRVGATIRRATAIPAAVLAAFGVGNGLLALPVLLWAAWAGGLGRFWLIAIGLTAAILFAVFLPGIETDQVDHLLDLAVWPKLADFYICFLGMPWCHAESLVWVGRLIGFIVLSASMITFLRCGILRRTVGRLERIGLSLLMFSLLTAAMAAAAGRWAVASERPIPIRYAIFTSLAQVGLLLANAPWLNRIWQKGYRRSFQWATLVAATVLLVQQVVAGQAAVAVTTDYYDSYRDFVAGHETAATAARPVFLGSATERDRLLQIMRVLKIYRN